VRHLYVCTILVGYVMQGGRGKNLVFDTICMHFVCRLLHMQYADQEDNFARCASKASLLPPSRPRPLPVSLLSLSLTRTHTHTHKHTHTHEKQDQASQGYTNTQGLKGRNAHSLSRGSQSRTAPPLRSQPNAGTGFKVPVSRTAHKMRNIGLFANPKGFCGYTGTPNLKC